MIDREYAITMATYNRWMNAKLYDAAAALSDAERREDRGAYFKSLQGTLEHLLSADNVWLYRFTGRSIDTLPMNAVYQDYAALRAQRERVDEQLLAWAATLEPAWLAADFVYFSKAYNAYYVKPAWLLVAHLFNHQTHHRGQATTLLMQFGIDPGATDLPAAPGL